MTKATKTITTSRPQMPAPLPPVLPPSAEEQARNASISAQLRELIAIHTQLNLDNAVTLAILASKGRLPKELQAHFGELGRRYAELARTGGVQKASSVRLATQDGVDVAGGQH